MRENGGIALAIAGAIFVFFVFVPFVLVVLLYVFFSVYALIKVSSFEYPGVNVAVMLTGVAVSTAGLVVLLHAGIGFLGKSLRPSSEDRARGED
jgi:hypothetical protein